MHVTNPLFRCDLHPCGHPGFCDCMAAAEGLGSSLYQGATVEVRAVLSVAL